MNEMEWISRKDVIDYLNELLDGRFKCGEEGLIQGIRNYIRQLPSAQPDVPGINDGDMISRQAAIDAVNTALFPKINTAKDAEKALKSLPSAQEKPFNLPEIHIAEGYDTIEGEDGNVGFGVYIPDENQIYVAGNVEDEIRAKALLHEICHWVQDMFGRPFDEDEANSFAEVVYDALPSAKPEQRWIPVSERLPKGLMVKVLVSAIDSDGLPIIPHVATYDGFTKTWSSSLEIANVEAWQPLPEPYRGEENEDY